MIKQPLVLSGVLWLGMALVSAGTPGEQDAPQVIKPPEKGDTVTIVGCLVQGDPSLNASPRPAGTSAAAGDFFIRTPAIQVPVGTTFSVGSSDPATAGTRGGRATTSAGAPDKTTLYRVMGLDRDALRLHLGHHVELQGQLRSDDTARGMTTRTTVDANGRPTTQVEKRMDLAGAIDATSIKIVSESCQ